MSRDGRTVIDMKVLTGTIKQTKMLNGELTGSSGRRDGKDGVSPTVTITDILDGAEIIGHRVSITDVNGTKSFDVMNGANGNPDAYTKPSTGIPKGDLASDVQASLGKADTALQDGDLDPVRDDIEGIETRLDQLLVLDNESF